MVVLDIVTSRQFNLHNEMVRMMNWGNASLMVPGDLLYAVALPPGATAGSEPDRRLAESSDYRAILAGRAAGSP